MRKWWCLFTFLVMLMSVPGPGWGWLGWMKKWETQKVFLEPWVSDSSTVSFNVTSFDTLTHLDMIVQVTTRRFRTSSVTSVTWLLMTQTNSAGGSSATGKESPTRSRRSTATVRRLSISVTECEWGRCYSRMTETEGVFHFNMQTMCLWWSNIY